MTKFYKRLATGIATSAMLLANFAPVFAATELVVTGNGSDSVNGVAVTQTGTTWVSQTNTTTISNDVHVDSNTGSNVAKDNTAGDVSIETGDSTAKVTLSNQAGTNVANVESCNCDGDTGVLVEGNGSGTQNGVELGKVDTTTLFQTNATKIDNDVDTDLSTGDNRAEDNTGGDVSILTGDAKSEVSATSVAGINVASIAPRSGNGGSASIIIRENGSDSKNNVGLLLGHSTWVDQLNATSISNDVDTDLETGDNEAKDNTGGSVGIETGDATVKVMLDNMAGFNTANVEDCCFDDVLAKIGGNGTDTKNAIKAVLDDDLTVWQDNLCGMFAPPVRTQELSVLDFGREYPHPTPCFNNDVRVDTQTGDNRNEDGTGSTEGDPSVLTGDSMTTVNVSNEGGSNSYGEEIDLGSPSSGFDFSFSFDLSDLLGWLQAHMS